MFEGGLGIGLNGCAGFADFEASVGGLECNPVYLLTDECEWLVAGLELLEPLA